MYYVRKNLALSGNIYNIAEYTTDEWAKSCILSLSGCYDLYKDLKPSIFWDLFCFDFL